MKDIRFQVLIIYLISFTVEASLIKDDITIETLVASSSAAIENHSSITPKSMKIYEAKNGKYISFVLALDKNISKVVCLSEYIGHTYDESSRQLKLFIDIDNLPNAVVNKLRVERFINKSSYIQQVLDQNFVFEVHKRKLLLNFSKANRALASEE